MKKNHSFIALYPKYALNLKLPLVMRISLALLFAVVLQLSAENGYAQRTHVAISMNNVSVEQVLNKIEEASDYVFLYNDKTIQKNRIVSVRNKSGKILDILDDIFKGTDITYTVVDKQIILSTNKMQLVQQEGQIQIKGVVKDAGGDPLIGVNVKVKDSTVGTITDINGNFTLQTRKGDILEISYVGYATKTVKVQNAQVLNIVLTEDTEVLNDPRVYESEIYCKLGDMIPEVTSSLCRSGHIIVTEDTPQNAIELAERLIRKVIIVTK